MSPDGLCRAAANDLPVNVDSGAELIIFFIEALQLSGHGPNYSDQFPIGVQRLQNVVNVGQLRMSVSHVFSFWTLPAMVTASFSIPVPQDERTQLCGHGPMFSNENATDSLRPVRQRYLTASESYTPRKLFRVITLQSRPRKKSAIIVLGALLGSALYVVPHRHNNGLP